MTDIEVQNLPANPNDPSMTTLPGGGRLLVWSSDDPDRDGIWAQRYNAAGHAVGQIYQINTTEAGTQNLPEATTLSDGSVIVTWMSGKDLYGQKLDANGALVGPELLIGDHNYDQKEPEVAGWPLCCGLDGGWSRWRPERGVRAAL